MGSLYLIDGNSYLYRAFYAIRGLATSEGTPTNAIYGFTTMLMKIIKEKAPDYFAIVFDAPGPTHRHDAYEDYKAHRPGMPDDLKIQVPLIKEVIQAFHIPIIEIPGYEADDILGTLAKRAEKEKLDVYILTGDKDMCQVVSPYVKLYDSMKEKVTGEKEVKEKFGIPPKQFPEIIALMGDASDNIPGAPGVGEKTAVKLLKEFGDLDSIIKNHEQIKNTRARNAVANNLDSIRMSLDLATIHLDIDLAHSVADLKVAEPDWKQLLEYFRKYQFSSLVRQVPNQESKPDVYTEYVTVLDRKALDRALKTVTDDIAIDTETTSTNPLDAELVGISFSVSPERAYYIPLAHAYPGAPKQLEKKDVLEKIRGILENSKVKKTGHNIKYDYEILMNEGIVLQGIAFDTMIASYLLNPNRANHNLTDTAMERLGVKTVSYKDVVGKDIKDFSEVSVETATEYSGEDAAVTLKLRNDLTPALRKQGLEKLFNEIEIPLIEVLAGMERAGIKLDTKLMEKYSKQIGGELTSIEKRIYFLAGEEFNINSPKQLQEILFEKLGLKPVKKTKTGYSTNIDVLEQLAHEHELPREIIEYRGLSKLISTYVDALPRMVNTRTGRLHTSYNQTVTATGRLSSSEPNLQNIPIRGEWGTRIRETFVAEKGSLLLSSDYSQIELRVFAHLSRDEGLIDAFNSDGDIHTRTACELFDVKSEEVTKEMRRSAKTVNFGIVYGISAYGLSQQLGIEPAEAGRYIDTYFARHSGVKEYIDSLINDATGKGYVTTLFGRKRAIPELRSTNRNIRQLGERLATNSPIQGTAADIIKISMLNIWDRLAREKLNTRMLLQVHDELLFEVPENEKDPVQALVREEMEGVVTLDIPLKVDIGIGRNWAEAH
ncbi:MAG: DNA polymerase I [Nitrospiraceae bacterium]|nr:MAG: DNA polymerase I [Nitrospiraceae bacterium]